MLAGLLNTPQTDEEWRRWAWDHRDSHDRIRQALLQKNNADLADRVIEPIVADHLDDFLENNTQLHDDMNNALQIESVDLESVNAENPNELAAWIRLHYQEHLNAEQVLQI